MGNTLVSEEFTNSIRVLGNSTKRSEGGGSFSFESVELCGID
ncbi:hypothetical protein N9268_01565 [Akkermansiaceae bacterium]|nr:hypothetical protein [Akkermansiaceae bacterium]MDA8876267.1 hypothetical protein [Akkermansiaceae bacterium]MDB4421642.1 hypothetical protein [Akkermansiaceae bacterium]